MPTRTRVLVWISSVAFAATEVVGLAQNQAAPPSQPPTFRTEANYVRVDVFPTANGAPVADLRQEEFQILEDGAPQKIEQFQHVVIRGNVPQEARREPTTVAESRAALRDPQARVFVLFLDNLHVDQIASRTIRRPLVDVVERLLGPDDLLAVMTPQMTAADITFARKTTILQGVLDRDWWGVRDSILSADKVEEQYKLCYPPPIGSSRQTSVIAQQMIDRRREKMTLDALESLVLFLGGAREERKAIIAVTDGWLLFQPDQGLTRQVDERPPSLPPLGVDPRNGKLTTKDTTLTGAGLRAECEQARLGLAQLNDDFQFNLLLDKANRANTSFYPVDPRGLTVFDTPIGPDPPPPIEIDRGQLRQRSVALRMLAGATDGTAVVGTNNIGPALTRIVADLSSYYLLGYYSTNTKLDGKFRSLSVKVTRPGVQVRARRGYLAATAAEVAARARAAPAPSSAGPAAASLAAVETVVGSLSRFAREAPLRVQAASGWNIGGAPAVWVVGELAAGEAAAGSTEANVTVLRDNASIATARATFTAGSRSFKVALKPSEPLAPGDYQVRVRARSTSGTGGPFDEVVGLVVAASPESIGALIARRGPSTGNKSVATADLRFRRSERVGVDVPAASSVQPAIRLLDRTGKPLAIPVAIAARDDGDGSRWYSGEVALAPLAPGDYVIEVSTESGGDARRTLVAFRVIP
jgi:VWFA-related protein